MELDRFYRVFPVLISLINLTFYLFAFPSNGFLYSSVSNSRINSEFNQISYTKLQSSPQFVQGSKNTIFIIPNYIPFSIFS